MKSKKVFIFSLLINREVNNLRDDDSVEVGGKREGRESDRSPFWINLCSELFLGKINCFVFQREYSKIIIIVIITKDRSQYVISLR